MSYTISRDIPQSSVTVEKWLHRNELRLGMYVAELDKPWDHTDFMFQGFILNTRELLESVQAESEYVLVLVNKMANTPLNSSNRMCGISNRKNKSLWGRVAR